MPRTEVRTFLVDPILRKTEARTVDLDNPNAYFPVGTVLTCENGHEVCTIVNALDTGQRVLAEDLGEWREGQRVVHSLDPEQQNWNEARLGPCWCGKEYARTSGNGRGQLHIKDLGWK
jgi:hypothetical protein